jgi:hypothetical protein
VAVESGRKVAVGIGRETTRGTAVAAAYWIKHAELDFRQRAEKANNDSSLNVLDAHNASEIVKDWGEGTISGKITDKSFPLILAAAAGQVPTSADNPDTDASVKDHTISQSQLNESMSLTVALKDLNRDERFALAMLRSLEISAEAGDWARFSAELVSKKPATASNTVAYVAENEFKAKHITVKLAANVAGLGAAPAVALRTFSITINRNVDPYFGLGQDDPTNIYAKEVEVSGEFTALFDSLTHRDNYLGSGYQAMQITLENTDVTIGSAARPKIVLTFPRVSLSDWDVDQGLGNIVEQTVGVKPLYSLSDGYTWSGVATNTVANY